MIEIHTSSLRNFHNIKKSLSSYYFDVRDLPNPFARDFLRDKDGRNPKVRDFMFSFPTFHYRVDEVVHKITELRFSIGQSSFIIYCKGGKHRSVVVAEEVASRLRTLGYEVKVIHHELEKPEKLEDIKK